MTEPRWLSADEQRAWRSYLEAYRLVFDAIEAQLQHDAGMPHAYYEILVRLSEAPGRSLRMTQLAQATWSSPSRLSHAVDRLEDRGWVRRSSCATDRRGQLAVLTDKGYAALAGAAPGHVEAVRQAVFDALGTEQAQQLGELSAQLIKHLAPPDVAAAHRIDTQPATANGQRATADQEKVTADEQLVAQ
jgi:DNA-binding MarR family transcriptional regulator